MGPRRFLAILTARNREFLRDRSTMAWNTVFPVLIVISFAYAFTIDNRDLFNVGILADTERSSDTQTASFLNIEHIHFFHVRELASAITKVERHQIDMLLDLRQRRYWINSQSANGYILEQLLLRSGGNMIKQTVSGEEIRYVDWLIPGILGMNVMFSSLFGVGYVIVRYRKNGVLKRLKATPLSAFEFLSAQVVSRLWLIVLLTTLIFTGTNLLVGFRMYGSYITLLVVLTLGTLSMISLGLIIAARMRSEEAANGLLNLISWPMMLMSGVWFSLEGSPAMVTKAAQLLPLTHAVGAARAVMIDGASMQDIGYNLGVLSLMTALFMFIGACSFRWE